MAAGTMDLEAVTLASGVLDDAQLVMSAGTWNIAVQVLERAVLDPLPLMQALCRDGTHYLLSEGSPTGVQNLAWLLHDVLETPDPDWPAINQMVEALPPEASQLIHLPFINGSGSAARAGFLGITGDSSRSHLLRAVYESTAFMHKLHMAEMAAVTARVPQCGRLSGGVTRSSAWSQMFADVLGIRVEVSEGTELGALGCAMLAAVAVGRYSCLEEAVRSMSRIVQVFEVDDKKHSVYERKYGLFLDVQNALQPHWGAFCGSDGKGATKQNKKETS